MPEEFDLIRRAQMQVVTDLAGAAERLREVKNAVAAKEEPPTKKVDR